MDDKASYNNCTHASLCLLYRCVAILLCGIDSYIVHISYHMVSAVQTQKNIIEQKKGHLANRAI